MTHEELLNDAELLRHNDTVGIRIIFSVPVGDALREQWTWREVFSGRAPAWLFADPPPFLYRSPERPDPEIEWHDPRMWAEYRGLVKSGKVTEDGPLWVDIARSWIWPDRSP